MANDFEKSGAPDPNRPGTPQKDQPDSYSPGGTPMTHKETSKPIAGPIPDAQNPDTNANMGEDKPNLTSRTAVEQRDSGQDLRKQIEEARRREQQGSSNEAEKRPVVETTPQDNPNFNPNPITAGSAEDRERSAGKYEGDIRTGQIIKVSPLNAGDDDFVVGKVTSLDVSGLGQVMYFDEGNTSKLASFHADDAELIYEPPSIETGRRMFINDDQTYDARELRAERPRNEKQYVEKQRVLRDQTAKSHFNKSLT